MKSSTLFSQIVLLSLIIFMINGSCFSQNHTTVQKEKWLGVHLNIGTGTDDINYVAGQSLDGTPELFVFEYDRLLNLGVSFNKTNDKNWFQEYSINVVDYSTDEDANFSTNAIIPGPVEPTFGYTRTNFDLWLRWEYGKMFVTDKKRKMVAGLSLSLDPFLLRNKILPNTSATFPLKSLKLGSELRIIPRMEYSFTSKLKLSFKIPIKVAYFYWSFSKIDSPFVATELRTSNITKSSFSFNNPQASLGLSYKVF